MRGEAATHRARGTVETVGCWVLGGNKGATVIYYNETLCTRVQKTCKHTCNRHANTYSRALLVHNSWWGTTYVPPFDNEK
jgi:hypothetical protein